MKKILILLVIAMVSCTSSNKKVVFLGDSITQNAVINSNEFKGFITLMREEVDSNIDLIGKGIGGDKVSDLLTRYRDDVINFLNKNEIIDSRVHAALNIIENHE